MNRRASQIHDRVARVSAFGLLLLISFASCTSASDPSDAAVASMSITTAIETDHQTGLLGAQLAKPLQARVLRNGAPVSGVSIVWSTAFGVVQPATSITDASGVASAGWTLGALDSDNALTSAVAIAAIANAPAKATTFAATISGDLTLELLPGSDQQSATVGTSLPNPLRVRARTLGQPRPGLEVRWTGVVDGVVKTSVTNSEGVATMGWTLPGRSDRYTAVASLDAIPRRGLPIVATAVPGAVDHLRVVSGDAQTTPLNSFAFAPLIVAAFDEYANPVSGVPTSWTIESGPGSLQGADAYTGLSGLSTTTVRPTGALGAIRVTATIGSASSTFRLFTTEAEYRVTLWTNSYEFSSAQNGSSSAVDTLPVGSQMVWTLSPFDYDFHTVTFFDDPANLGQFPFPYANPSQVRVRFTKPGVYRYRDEGYGIEGRVDVVP